MILKNILPCEFVYPTTYLKIYLGKSNINTFLGMFSKMKNLGTSSSSDFLDNYKKSPTGTTLTKKTTFLTNALNAKKYVKINGWFGANGLENLEGVVSGPIVTGREILFYHENENLLLLFTYFPLHILQKKADLDDVVMRELKTYVYDNFPKAKFDELCERVCETVEIDDMFSHRSLTTKYSKNPNEIIKIVNVLGNFQWSIINRLSGRNFNNDGNEY